MKLPVLIGLLLCVGALAQVDTTGPENETTPEFTVDTTTELDIPTTEEIGSDELPLAEPCDLDACELPSCRCASTDIPGEILPRNTPQFVIVTFDDAVNIRNIETYRSVLYNRRNSNNCPAGVTFFVNHEYTDYQRVNELYNNGFEIALHSITHQVPQSYWAEADYDTIKKEIVDQRIQMSHFANIPYDSIQGVRLPFLQMSGNISFQVMADHGLTYDSSWPSIDYISPGLWPYTLDYASVQDCQTPPCPTASIPNTPWVMPMVAWLDLEGLACAMVDSCYHIPDLGDEEGWYRFILTNFERQYMGNRSPFNFFIHEWYLDAYPPVKAAFIRFLNLINNLPDVFMVNAREVVDWMKDPVSVDEYRARPCRTWIPTNCPATGCGPLVSQHNQMSYWMQICNVCPNSYPWIDNPLGQ